MREINKSITYEKKQIINDIAVKEDVVSITEDKINKRIDVCTALKNADEEVVGEKAYTIAGDKYDLLISANPSFAPNKPENEYREIDLWYVIDLIDKENTTP
jgi:hypothetical protein